MIVNNMMLKLKNSDSETIAKTKDVLLSMQGKIEPLIDIKVEADIRHGKFSYDIIFITKFASMDDMNAYLNHPVHIEASKYITSVIENQVAICYEA